MSPRFDIRSPPHVLAIWWTSAY